ncbi:MAG: TrkH family potassium uptake protein [Ruminococcus sp.]|nr:TrkH family potassium uptake protein [Ruminococcus sp.]
MNYKMVWYIMGQICKVAGLAMLLPILVGAYYREHHVVLSFGVPFMILMLIGLAATIKKPKDKAVFSTEGFVSVAASWITVSAVGALPFVISGEIPNYVNALFETVSGFTTTGATILSDVEKMSRACMFWRAFTHWLGGMGILMLVIAVMSSNDSRTMHMMRAECAGPNVGRLVSKSSVSARILYGIYMSLTASEVVLLLCGGMPLYDCLIHSFSSAGTGGFSLWGDSIGHYNSLYIEMVVAVFIILFGVNFNLYYYILIRKFALAFRNEEVRVYFGLIAGATAVITLNIMHLYSSVGGALRHSFFMVASTITSTGFATADITQWPVFSQTLLVLLMFVGSCAGSTGGGMKVSRWMILFKTGIKELKYIANPRAVATVKMDGKPVEKGVVRGATSYLVLFMLLLGASLLIVTLDDYSFQESASAVITCMNNIGFGLGRFGPAGNFGGLSELSKCVLCADMLLGRLEIYPLLMLFASKKR